MNNYIVRSYLFVIVATNIVTRRISKVGVIKRPLYVPSVDSLLPSKYSTEMWQFFEFFELYPTLELDMVTGHPKEVDKRPT